jgi:hypothetical protein
MRRDRLLVERGEGMVDIPVAQIGAMNGDREGGIEHDIFVHTLAIMVDCARLQRKRHAPIPPLSVSA